MAHPTRRHLLRIRKRGRDEWDEGADGGLPSCPLVPQPVPMEDRSSYPHLQRACPDGVDTRSSWTLEQLECLWAELDQLLTEVDDRRARLHGERAALTAWMAISMLKSPAIAPVEDDAMGGARTRSSALVGALDGIGLARQLSVTVKGARDRHGRFLKSELDSPRADSRADAAASAGAYASAAHGGRAKGADQPPDHEHEGEAAGYEIRRVSDEADPEALWLYTEAFFAPLSRADAEVLDAGLRVRRFWGDDFDAAADPFALGPRGQHYLLQWEDEARLLGLASIGAFHATAPSSAAAAAAGAGAGAACLGAPHDRVHWLSSAREHPLTARVFNALVDRPGFVPRLDMAPTRAGAVDSLAQPTPHAAMSVVGEADTRERAARLDGELRAELVRVGLLDSAGAQLADEDDTLCVELRHLQAQLRASIAQNEALCRESRARFDAFLAEHEVERASQAQADALVERWRAVMKRLKAERKAERRRTKAAGGGRKVADASAPLPPRADDARGAHPDAAQSAVAAESADAPAAAARAKGDEGASNDESSEEEREEEPGPGWGAAAPDAIASAAAPPFARPTTARKRTTRAHPSLQLAPAALS
ncbi:hypothetical protein KFE25_010005 [Diacronema lutheri]|uniref:Histone acetyltransferase n=1 Tax=Diacronema lutheri TaxID=2081491 RepID=A0A8J5XI95_DIALT|nr:hypothetical protein KFE25_010005 [Diacronema lutheri]